MVGISWINLRERGGRERERGGRIEREIDTNNRGGARACNIILDHNEKLNHTHTHTHAHTHTHVYCILEDSKLED